MRTTIFFLVVLAIPGPLAADEPSLVGNWALVEQGYGSGRANLPIPDAWDERLQLEVRQLGSGLEARLRTAPRDETGLTWPSWEIAGRRASIELLERTIDADASTLVARYRVHPSANGDMTLEVEERYRIQGPALVGTVELRFERDGKARGSYVLRRRFERVP